MYIYIHNLPKRCIKLFCTGTGSNVNRVYVIRAPGNIAGS